MIPRNLMHAEFLHFAQGAVVHTFILHHECRTLFDVARQDCFFSIGADGNQYHLVFSHGSSAPMFEAVVAAQLVIHPINLQ